MTSLTGILTPENGAICKEELRGAVYIWGSDNKGQLGLNIPEDEKISTIESDIMSAASFLDEGVKVQLPRFLTFLKDAIVKDIACGLDHCIAVTIEGRCFSWGNNEFSQLGLGEKLCGKRIPLPT